MFTNYFGDSGYFSRNKTKSIFMKIRAMSYPISIKYIRSTHWLLSEEISNILSGPIHLKIVFQSAQISLHKMICAEYLDKNYDKVTMNFFVCQRVNCIFLTTTFFSFFPVIVVCYFQKTMLPNDNQ